jgi:hypothetical protein
MNLGEAATFLVDLEMVYRMGRAIGKRGEISSLVEHNKLRTLFA